MHEIEKVK